VPEIEQQQPAQPDLTAARRRARATATHLRNSAINLSRMSDADLDVLEAQLEGIENVVAQLRNAA
jgi:hypothetical protein